MDKESLRREKAREAYEQLRQRPRSRHDTPSLQAFFAPGHEALAEGLDRFHALIAEFVGASPFFDSWIIARTPEEQTSGRGFDILSHKDEHLDFLKKKGGDDENFSISALATSRHIDNNVPLNVTATCNYSGGRNERRHDRFSLNFYTPPEDQNLTLQEYLTLIRSIVAWREPRLITVGPGTYSTYDRVFWHRAWKGWIGWFPQEISPSILPDFALTWRIGNGTAVATQETNVLSRYPDQRQRANEVEMALTDAGILPTEDEVKGF